MRSNLGWGDISISHARLFKSLSVLLDITRTFNIKLLFNKVDFCVYTSCMHTENDDTVQNYIFILQLPQLPNCMTVIASRQAKEERNSTTSTTSSRRLS